ncbi:putative feruloyl esterase C [Corynascus novoguineensis]|uniref:feruloyl esterase n=1 Tax=Corynascus novoguineensis TaxID=1126955 RepID=A0AAN7HRF8_9PEZI|nr:putative feruloyl esterase C [Corynascus novoguineensis]
MQRPKSMAAAALLTLSWLGAAMAASSAGCGKDPTLGSQQYTLQVNGQQREYILKLPDSYDKDHPYRLVFLWHQRGGSATKIVQGEDPNRGGVVPYYGLPPLANNSAIFVVPNGLNAGWANYNGEDTAFFDQMVETIEADLCVDQNLRFSTGFSWGGGMSYSLACSRANMIRAVAVLSGAELSGCDGGTDPVAYYGQHGTSDSVLNVAMGRQLRDRFVSNNGCTRLASEPNPNGGTSVKTEYEGCQEGYPVTWVIHNGDHNPSQVDQGSSYPFAPQNTWDFFSQFT